MMFMTICVMQYDFILIELEVVIVDFIQMR